LESGLGAGAVRWPRGTRGQAAKGSETSASWRALYSACGFGAVAQARSTAHPAIQEVSTRGLRFIAALRGIHSSGSSTMPSRQMEPKSALRCCGTSRMGGLSKLSLPRTHPPRDDAGGISRAHAQDCVKGRTLEERVHPLAPGTRVGAWRVRAWQGQGGYGAVYRAERVGWRRSQPGALKVSLSPWGWRMEREVELLSRLSHPSIPRLLDPGGPWPPSGVEHPFFVMEWVEGTPLYAWAEQRAPSCRQVCRVLAHLARALEAVHAAGAVHRDVRGTMSSSGCRTGARCSSTSARATLLGPSA